jgi:hypothetical protein
MSQYSSCVYSTSVREELALAVQSNNILRTCITVTSNTSEKYGAPFYEDLYLED